jgi:hypothetical protein
LIVTLILSVGCSSKKDDKYKVSEQTPANYITADRSEDDVVRHHESACQTPDPFEGAAYEYLEVLVNTGGRRSGTQGYRCAAAFARDQLSSLGYEAAELEYTFPYYDFDPDSIKVTRLSDGEKFPACTMHYSLPVNGARQGKVCRARPGSLTGCFVLIDTYKGRTDIKKKYGDWKERGAVGVIREADMRPLGAKGLRHSARAHTTSWYYAPLPGFVVEDARKLLGETVEVKSETRIAQGTGYSVVAKGPSKNGRYVMVTAHLDCWFIGALDDGSGSAVLLEAARLMKDDPEGLIFLLADTEEIGLIGSAAYVQAMGTDHIDAVIELDMVSSLNNFGKNKTPETAGMMPRFITYTKGTKPVAKEMLEPLDGRKFYLPVSATRRLMGGLRTDMEWFHAAGVPGIFIYTPSKFYHTEKDTIEWVPAEDLAEVAVQVAGMARELREKADGFPAPKNIVPFEFTAAMSDGDSVTFEVTVAEDAGPPGIKRPKVAVHAFFEQGYEEKVKLDKGDDGVWRGEFRPARPGRWQFLAVYSRGKNFGKRWAELKVD